MSTLFKKLPEESVNRFAKRSVYRKKNLKKSNSTQASETWQHPNLFVAQPLGVAPMSRLKHTLFFN